MNSARLVHTLIAFALLTLALGCASSKLQGKRSFVTDAKMNRPSQILVYNFRANLKKVDVDERKEQKEYLDEARDALAEQLVERFRKMGMMAEHVGRDVKPKPDELVIDGEFITIDEGNRFTRNVIGFGVGSTEMVAQVQVLRGRADVAGMQLVFALSYGGRAEIA